MPLTLNYADAISAYNRAARSGGTVEPPRNESGPAPVEGFAQALKEATQDGVETLRESEAVSLKAAVGQADLTELVSAVSKAEMTLQTAVTVRDRVIQAYQEIIRMPI